MINLGAFLIRYLGHLAFGFKLRFQMPVAVAGNDNVFPSVRLKWLYKAVASAGTEAAAALLAVAPVSDRRALIAVVAPAGY